MYGINLTVALQSRKEYVKKRTCSKNVDVFIANFELLKKCPYSELIWSSFFPHFPAFGLNTERPTTLVNNREF